MKVTVKSEVEVTTLVADMGPRYWEDSKVNGKEDDADNPTIPLKHGDRWILTIDLNTGKIENWSKGVTADVHYKVCDDGVYKLYDESGNEVTRSAKYVPAMLSPAGYGDYGDYVIMKIDSEGYIENFRADLIYFEEDDH